MRNCLDQALEVIHKVMACDDKVEVSGRSVCAARLWDSCRYTSWASHVASGGGAVPPVGPITPMTHTLLMFFPMTSLAMSMTLRLPAGSFWRLPSCMSAGAVLPTCLPLLLCSLPFPECYPAG